MCLLAFPTQFIMKVAIIGTVGLPANYGGFETLVEQLVRHNDSGNIQYEVFCSSKSYPVKSDSFLGAQLKYVPLKANGIQSIPYDIISLIKATKSADIILVLGVSGCAALPIYRFFSGKKIIINIDGLEHRRDKWNKWVRRFLKFSERRAVRYADIIVTDNKCITDYVKDEYGKESELIAYGGDHVLTGHENVQTEKILNEYGLSSGEYALGICRIEPENNVNIILEAFEKARKNLVVIGNWLSNPYAKALADKYRNSSYVRLLPAVYNLDILHVIRSNCALYLHGHSAGGTNPSLVEAMFYKKPIMAFDCVYNRETTENKAIYFKSATDLVSKLSEGREDFNKIAQDMYEIANRRYRWNTISSQYEKLFFDSKH